jgi:hypothetical protein
MIPIPKEEELLDFLDGLLTPARAEQILEMIRTDDAVCDMANSLADARLELGLMFEAARPAKPQTHPLVRLREALASMPAGLTERLERWIQKGSELAVKISIADAASYLSYSLNELSRYCVNDAMFAPEAVGSRSAEPGSATFDSPILELASEGKCRVEINTVVDDSIVVTVLIYAFPQQPPYPIAAVLPGAGLAPQAQQMEALEEVGDGLPVDLMARFVLPREAGPVEVYLEPFTERS